MEHQLAVSGDGQRSSHCATDRPQQPWFPTTSRVQNWMIDSRPSFQRLPMNNGTGGSHIGWNPSSYSMVSNRVSSLRQTVVPQSTSTTLRMNSVRADFMMDAF
jgi:hypothetical protein